MYRRITPLPEQPNQLAELAVDELRGLETVWQERKAVLEESGNLREFLIRLKRDWAIETGVIERLYTWDRGVTEVLIERGISTALIAHSGGLTQAEASQVRLLIEDQYDVVEGLFEVVKDTRPLTEHLIRGLHQNFTLHQDYSDCVTPKGQRVRVPLLKGAYKREPNNPRRADGTIHEYCPPELVDEEMGRLVDWYREAGSNAVVPEVLSAWLHHRFTQIHPFQDGNGRVARALASLVFLKAGVFPLVIRKQDVEYIDLLEEADRGELGPLVQFFAERQKKTILAALAADYEVQRVRQIDEIIGAALGVLEQRATSYEAELEQVFAVAEQLRELAHAELERIAAGIDASIRGLVSRTGDWNSGASTAAPPRAEGELVLQADRGGCPRTGLLGELRTLSVLGLHGDQDRLAVRTRHLLSWLRQQISGGARCLARAPIGLESRADARLGRPVALSLGTRSMPDSSAW